MDEIQDMKRQAIEAIERRAFEVRKSMSAVCDKAHLSRQTWFNAKHRLKIGVDALGRLEEALGEMEAEKGR